MKTSAIFCLGQFLIAAATVLTGCADDPTMGPDSAIFQPVRIGAPESDLSLLASATDSGDSFRAPDLGSCDSLRAPTGTKLALHTYATGVQIYRWTGAAWTFIAPSATLFADAAGNGTIGTHFGGPTWKSNSGSMVVGTVLKRCVPDAGSIPWLLLSAASTDGPGIFDGVTHLQRLTTVGGNAPSQPGSIVGDEAQVPYSAEYVFYRAQ